VAERVVRFTEQSFDRLEAFLPEERGPDGSPSLTDFLLLDLPVIRDRLAADYEGVTMGTVERRSVLGGHRLGGMSGLA
jgi:hypothetical protein